MIYVVAGDIVLANKIYKYMISKVKMLSEIWVQEILSSMSKLEYMKCFKTNKSKQGWELMKAKNTHEWPVLLLDTRPDFRSNRM